MRGNLGNVGVPLTNPLGALIIWVP